jgi:predicted 2-oxoglutarate/Fe(II)-dependent dioxygenase YbiX
MTKAPETAALASGPFAPTTHGVALDQSFFSLDAQAGRAVVLLFVGQLPLAETDGALAALQLSAHAFSACGVDLVALVEWEAPRATEYLQTDAMGVRVVFSYADVFAGWGFSHRRPALVALDRGGRVVGSPLIACPAAVAAHLAALAARRREAAFDDSLPAPVLIVPDVLSASLCRELMQHFEAGRPAFGGMASVGVDGAAVHKIDAGKKHRYDLVLGAGDPFLSQVLTGIVSRCVPEIARAFHVDIAHTDRILLARYDETGGYFRRHRDNSAPSVAFRQFALSLNLNDDYDGGHVLFPEYNDRRYRPPAGAGVVFSCSLLHEAAPVTRGKRYCALTFLHNAAAQARWMGMSRRAS